MKATKSIYNSKYHRVIAVLVRERKASGLTQSELAKRIGRTQSEVSKIERCERRVDIIEFFHWLKATRGTIPTDLSFLVNEVIDG